MTKTSFRSRRLGRHERPFPGAFTNLIEEVRRGGVEPPLALQLGSGPLDLGTDSRMGKSTQPDRAPQQRSSTPYAFALLD